MNKFEYPFLRNTGVIHLDASAAFPLHDSVIADVNNAMTATLGAPGKANYLSSMFVTEETGRIREAVARFIGAEPSEIFFTASATDAVKIITEMWAKDARALYSPEDHSRVISEVARRTSSISGVSYLENGEYDYESMHDAEVDVAFLSSLHHLYGSTNDLSKIRGALPGVKIVIDASQSISRHQIDVKNGAIDALFFSSQKVGGIAGVGILYIAKRHHSSYDMSLVEPNTIPYIPLVSLRSALHILRNEDMNRVNLELAKHTAQLVSNLQHNPAVVFSKGPAYPDYMCSGNGILSFAVNGYSSHDIAMILEEHKIQVRAGDHCVDKDAVDQDVVRISTHRYTNKDDIKKITDVIKML